MAITAKYDGKPLQVPVTPAMSETIDKIADSSGISRAAAARNLLVIALGSKKSGEE